MYGMPQPNQYGQYPAFGAYAGFPPGTPAAANATAGTGAIGTTPAGAANAAPRPGQAQADGQTAQTAWPSDPNAFYTQSYWGGSLSQ